MDNAAHPSPQSDPWIEWVAHNLALGTAEHELVSEMESSGIGSDDIAKILSDVKDSPVFKAAKHIARDLRKWEDLSDVLLELESLCFDFKEIPRVKGISSQDFLNDFYALNRPVIIEDVVSEWPARVKWNLDFLKDNYGEGRVKYQSGRSARNHRDAFVDHSTESTLADYIQRIEAEGPTSHHYLIAHDRLLDEPYFAGLLKDVRLDPRYFDSSGLTGRVFFWLGPEGSVTPMHRDLGNVFFAQILGRKRVKMIPSRQLHKVYNETGYHSEVDFEAPDVERFPLLREAYLSDVVVEPGELLFIPVGWWHHVKSLDVAITITGNNFCFPNKFTEIF